MAVSVEMLCVCHAVRCAPCMVGARPESARDEFGFVDNLQNRSAEQCRDCDLSRIGFRARVSAVANETVSFVVLVDGLVVQE